MEHTLGREPGLLQAPLWMAPPIRTQLRALGTLLKASENHEIIEEPRQRVPLGRSRGFSSGLWRKVEEGRYMLSFPFLNYNQRL